MALNNNYDYYIDMHTFKVKKPSEVASEYKTIFSMQTTDTYKGVRGKRGRAEQDAIKKHINHNKYVLRHMMNDDEDYESYTTSLVELRAKLPTITETNYPEWFI